MAFNPQKKPEKQEKKRRTSQWVGGRLIAIFQAPSIKKSPKNAQKYRTSGGQLLTDGQIQSRLSKSYSNNPKPSEWICECCGKEQATDHDHTLSQRKCKILKITEWIWSVFNWSLSCRTCHQEWESYKSGAFRNHLNYDQRMGFLKEIAPEEYQKRLLA